MENLNAEKVKSELEGLAKFRTCPEYIKNALALITSQEQRIKELTEENERLRDTAYRRECEVHRERADTVRKMQEKLIKGAFCSACGIDYSHHIIQIAKEMLENE